MIGKKIRIERIMDRNSGKSLIIPMDHGISDGPIKGLVDMKKTVSKVVEGGANAVLMHKGLVAAGHREQGRDAGLIIHLSAGTSISPDPLDKQIITTVEEAVQLGADAVSIHINVGAPTTPEQLKDSGQIVRDCKRFGIPLIAMMYPRGEKVTDEKDVEMVKIAARIVKTSGYIYFKLATCCPNKELFI